MKGQYLNKNNMNQYIDNKLCDFFLKDNYIFYQWILYEYIQKDGAEKYYEKETNDNNNADLEEYIIPSEFEQKIEFLCSQKLNKHIRMRSSDTNFFYKVITESNITNNNDLEKGIVYVREKIKQKNEAILRNVDTKGSTCVQVISEYHNKIKDSDYKGLLQMCIQDKCTDNQIPPLLEKVFSLSVKCYQIVLTILLCSDQESIEKWWNINKDNQNITEEFFNELKELQKQLSIKNEIHVNIISMFVSKRITGSLGESMKQNNNGNSGNNNQQPNKNGIKQESQTQLYQEMAHDFLQDLYGNMQQNIEKNDEKANQFKKSHSNDADQKPNNPLSQQNSNRNNNEQVQNKIVQQQEEKVPEQMKEYVNSYLSKLFKQVVNECEFCENINDFESEENDHKASACQNYSIGFYIKKKSMYLSTKEF